MWPHLTKHYKLFMFVIGRHFGSLLQTRSLRDSFVIPELTSNTNGYFINQNIKKKR